ncbi:MAG TPA: hypothetical protein VJN88_02975 [Ktedonobacterales bacterium]|nr:hypothetical protein [Ktedonobacterales bacterium]
MGDMEYDDTRSAFDAPTDVEVTSLAPRRLPTRLSRPVAARVLAIAGAVLFGLAAWTPWMVVAIPASGTRQVVASFPDNAQGIALVFWLMFAHGSADPAHITQHPTITHLAGALWTLLPAVGILLAPLLWRRPLTLGGLWALRLYTLWLGLAALLSLCVGGTLEWYARHSTGPFNSPFNSLIWQTRWGLPLAVVALAISAFATMRLWRERALAYAQPPIVPSPHSQPQRWAAWTLSLGIGLWLVGFVVTPWATVNCTDVPFTLNHFVEGSCAGLDSGDALSTLAAFHLSPTVWIFGRGIYSLYGLLIGAAALFIIGAWMARRPTRAYCVWLCLWLAAASILAFLAARGVARITVDSPVLAAQAVGQWRGAVGIPITLAGLLVAWLAVIPLERARAPGAA